ncbi:mechanosensitive ion channel protein MscS [Chryseobacterium piperi]|uniref:Mechanosensitive ion channel protein MscS n=1 Tax=Chryseobacterium piperi TaxID=558152 RepID=A0A086BF89_9FLAO|nr:mechanosensitive ion channel domain-containing protein [Chryseobacterium piperi]ASW75325.1 mechanosensitive ion channel protein MscS [Chryseobacterium piperi]KFF27603.1 mechanosensitive ion channel protein MscS [Chryseobacterium piperi]
MNDEVKNIKENVSVTFKEILEYQIFSLGKYNLTVYEVLGALIIIILGFFISKFARRFIYKSEKLDFGKKFAFAQILHYLIVIVIFFLAMKMLGVNISPLLVGSGAILVGIGLGLQNLFLDFISGVIILFDRTIQAGDIIDVDGTIGKVQEIKMRTTTVLTRDNKNIIFPNSILTKDKLVNFSHNDEIVSFDINVGVHYDSDLDLVEKLMKEAALEHEEVLNDPPPVVRLENFGDSSLDMKMYYNSKNLFKQPSIRSGIRKAVLKKFRENNVNIPYPIRTLDMPKDTFSDK